MTNGNRTSTMNGKGSFPREQFGEKVRVGERSCIIWSSTNFSTESTDKADELIMRTIGPQAKLFPGNNSDNSKPQDQNINSIDASWRLDRSDGTNRSLNLTKIETRQPSAPPSAP